MRTFKALHSGTVWVGLFARSNKIAYLSITIGKLLIFARYVFLIYGSDIYELRKHVHVTYNHRGFKRSCKFWLETEVSLDENKKGDFTDKEIREIADLIQENKQILLAQLELFYTYQQVKAIRQ